MKKVTITKATGEIGVLILADDGKWDITLNGAKAAANYHYDTAQVNKIIVGAKAAGSAVIIE